jgi:D-alanyl-D-alanine carboxypeptidase
MKRSGIAYKTPFQLALGAAFAGIVLLAATTVGPQQAAAGGKYAALIIDANTGRVLHDHAADEARFPASLAKMMTLYIVFEQLQQKRLSPSTRITISENAADTAPSKLGLKAGSDIAVIDAVRALITKSANDIAVALAEHIGGSEDRFARLMTQKAKLLGMGSTTFRNPHGLPDSGQVTTARDMVTLALHLNDDFPQYFPLFATRAFAYNGSVYRNHNTLLGRFEGIDGIKTGYTTASGFNLVSSVRRDGKHVVGAVFGGNTAAARNAHMRVLLSRALERASTHKTRRPMLVARTEVPSPRRAQRTTVGSAQEPIRVAQAPAARGEPARLPPVTITEASERDLSTNAQVQMPSPRIEIARVRAVPVAPRTRVVEARMQSFSDGAAPVVRTAEAAPRAYASMEDLLERGAAPSSLDAQAERISRGQPVLTASTWATASMVSHNQPVAAVRTAAAAPSGGFAVQVGAFNSEQEARRGLQTARERAGSALGSASPLTQPVQAGGKQLYRARFAGFDAQGASAACQELKRRQVDCLVVRGE